MLSDIELTCLCVLCRVTGQSLNAVQQKLEMSAPTPQPGQGQIMTAQPGNVGMPPLQGQNVVFQPQMPAMMQQQPQPPSQQQLQQQMQQLHIQQQMLSQQQQQQQPVYRPYHQQLVTQSSQEAQFIPQPVGTFVPIQPATGSLPQGVYAPPQMVMGAINPMGVVNGQIVQGGVTPVQGEEGMPGGGDNKSFANFEQNLKTIMAKQMNGGGKGAADSAPDTPVSGQLNEPPFAPGRFSSSPVNNQVTEMNVKPPATTGEAMSK